MNKLLALSLMILAGCGSTGLDTVVQTNTVEIPTPVELTDVAEVVAEENAYRLAAGQSPLQPGLVCTLHNLSATQPATIPASPPTAVATWVYVGDFNVPNGPSSAGMPFLPAAIRLSYTSWYLVRCTGQLIVTVSEYATLYTASDDGSMLYLGSVSSPSSASLLVNNDGNHGVQTRSGSRLVKRGVFAIRIDYMQGPAGNQAFIVSDHNGVLPAARFYR